MIGYKVVVARNKNLVSPYQKGRNSTRYKINKQISRKAGYGPISVWEDITSAENFIEKYKIQNARIYEVEYTPSNETNLYTNKKQTIHIPSNMKLADSVILKTKVYPKRLTSSDL